MRKLCLNWCFVKIDAMRFSLLTSPIKNFYIIFNNELKNFNRVPVRSGTTRTRTTKSRPYRNGGNTSQKSHMLVGIDRRGRFLVVKKFERRAAM